MLRLFFDIPTGKKPCTIVHLLSHAAPSQVYTELSLFFELMSINLGTIKGLRCSHQDGERSLETSQRVFLSIEEHIRVSEEPVGLLASDIAASARHATNTLNMPACILLKMSREADE